MVELAENLDTFHPNLVQFLPILAFQMLYNFAQNWSKLCSKCGAKIPKLIHWKYPNYTQIFNEIQACIFDDFNIQIGFRTNFRLI